MPSQKCFQGSQSLSSTLSTTELRQHARRYGGNFLVTKIFFFAKLVWWFNLGGRVAKSGYSNENGYSGDGKHWRTLRSTREFGETINTFFISKRTLVWRHQWWAVDNVYSHGNFNFDTHRVSSFVHPLWKMPKKARTLRPRIEM